MNAFFKPLRRKIGVLILMAACLLTGGLFRSWEKSDNLQFVAFNYFNQVVMKGGGPSAGESTRTILISSVMSRVNGRQGRSQLQIDFIR